MSRAINIDDLVEPRLEEITLPRVPTLIRSHESRVLALKQPGIAAARRINLQENLCTTAATRQIRLLRISAKATADRGLREFFTED